MFKKDDYLSHRNKPQKMLLFGAAFVSIFAGLSLLVMLLWNAIIPEITGFKPLNFWKAAGLLLLAKILFGRVGGRRSPWKHSRRKHWKNKWMEMNPEERQQAKLRWKDYCSRRSTDDPGGTDTRH